MQQHGLVMWWEKKNNMHLSAGPMSVWYCPFSAQMNKKQRVGGALKEQEACFELPVKKKKNYTSLIAKNVILIYCPCFQSEQCRRKRKESWLHYVTATPLKTRGQVLGAVFGLILGRTSCAERWDLVLSLYALWLASPAGRQQWCLHSGRGVDLLVEDLGLSL